MTWRALSGTGSAPSGSTGSSGRTGSSGGQSPDTQSPDGQSPDDGHRVEENQGWSIFSYLISGMVVYGLLGWLVASLTHIPVLLPLGALLGLVFAIGGVVWKYGRHQ
jgi:F0F1-type ATP synthase assembly protein I